MVKNIGFNLFFEKRQIVDNYTISKFTSLAMSQHLYERLYAISFLI
jgi:hypothetical protein